MITLSIKNLVEKLKLFSFKRKNSHNIKSEVNNKDTSIKKQVNNQITHQVNYYGHEKKKREERTIDYESSQQGEYIPLDPIAIDPFASDLMNKVF